MKRKLVIFSVIVVAGIAILFLFFNNQANAPEQNTQNAENSEQSTENPAEFDKTKYSIDDQTSIWLVVNKQRPISTDYIPADLVDVSVNKRPDKSAEELMMRQEAAKAMEDLFAGASTENINLLLGSAYRSATLQNTYYSNYVATYGQAEADKFSAKPGTSEHQTGLGADLSTADKSCYLEICFADTPEGKWLAANAYKYGFIVRYMKGKEDITGYQYEPWHIRYVGVDLAKQIYDANQVMEEYFNL